MSSNYPPGVNDGTYGAPWNDEQFCVEIVVKMTIPFTLLGPIKDSSEEEATEIGSEDSIEQIREVLEALGVEDIEIISKNVTKC